MTKHDLSGYINLFKIIYSDEITKRHNTENKEPTEDGKPHR